MSIAPQSASHPGPWPAPDPGYIPLRPLGVGDLIGGGLGVVRRHIALLGPIAVVIAAVAAAVDLALMSRTGTLESFASGQWIDELRDGLATGRVDALPTGIYVAVLASSLISLAGGLWLSSIAAACAGADAAGRTHAPGTISGRLRGRLGPAAVVAAIVAVAALAGSFALVVPGVLAFMVWSVAAPVSAMEGSGPVAALARSARLTRGHRWRILGVTLLVLIITVAIESVVSAAVLTIGGIAAPVPMLVVSSAVGALVAAATMSWVSAVIALLYVDIRIRNEGLGVALRAHAAGFTAS